MRRYGISVLRERSVLKGEAGQHGGERTAAVFDIRFLRRPQAEEILLAFCGGETAAERFAGFLVAQLYVQPDGMSARRHRGERSAVRKVEADGNVFEIGFSVQAELQPARGVADSVIFFEDVREHFAALCAFRGIVQADHAIIIKYFDRSVNIVN